METARVTRRGDLHMFRNVERTGKLEVPTDSSRQRFKADQQIWDR